ncbi:hypothetical protein ACSUZJ_00785 [Telluria sp. B2]
MIKDFMGREEGCLRACLRGAASAVGNTAQAASQAAKARLLIFMLLDMLFASSNKKAHARKAFAFLARALPYSPIQIRRTCR